MISYSKLNSFYSVNNTTVKPLPFDSFCLSFLYIKQIPSSLSLSGSSVSLCRCRGWFTWWAAWSGCSLTTSAMSASAPTSSTSWRPRLSGQRSAAFWVKQLFLVWWVGSWYTSFHLHPELQVNCGHGVWTQYFSAGSLIPITSHF